MEDKALNEKESLELISRMIQNTKKHMELGQGNSLLLWGYAMVGVTMLVYVLLLLTANNPHCNWAWCLIPVIGGGVTYYWKSKEAPSVKTYTDKAISAVWNGIGFTFFTTVLMMFLWGGWPLMVPLSLLYVSIGVYMTGSILSDTWMYRFPMFGMMMSLVMLLYIYRGESDWDLYLLMYALSGIVVLIIPGHILNHRAKKEAASCSGN